jgi:hypothetical protein
MRPQDIVILLKIAAKGDNAWLMKDLAHELFISPSEVTESMNRNVYAGLLNADKRKVMKSALLDFLKYGLKYVYPQRVGTLVRGIPTAHSTLPLSNLIESEVMYVWPNAYGEVKGMALQPLIASLPEACKQDTVLYELVSLTEALRIGRTREQEIAYIELKKRL